MSTKVQVDRRNHFYWSKSSNNYSQFQQTEYFKIASTEYFKRSCHTQKKDKCLR